ncbi:hypothetical protein M5D96_009766 [Drosophila gunungcola]|uniref:Pickpocket protein 28 n=1 Tax=Drosophila gunungcola TaxID=103775 RepID=A0A9P9YIX6_9MUSC|nr:hypothetical protein M5D96_009766 [Drosophila gunungcola]
MKMELAVPGRPDRQGSSVFLFKCFVRSLRQFLNETGLHGLKFVGDSNLSSWERSFFFGSFVTALIITVHLISNIYVKWDSTPVIIGISPHATSILKVPFPAITICNMNQVLRSRVANYREGSNESALLKFLCDSESRQSQELDVEPSDSNIARNDLKVSDFVLNHSQSCERMLLFCKFSAMERNCSHLFQPILTDEGLCCELVYFHNPVEMPMVKEAGLITAIGYETNYRIEMVRAEAVPAIRSISRDGRQCLFKNEKELIYYRIYTRLNCENECVAAYLWVKCRQQCLPSCFDLNYLASGFAFPLASNNFQLANALVEGINKSYLSENIAVINVYFRESVYHGNTKNAYVGLTEFLSNVGGVMGLFMGFSVISLAEILYFLILKPLAELFVWKRSSNVDSENSLKRNAFGIEQTKTSYHQNVWHTRELYPKGVTLKATERVRKMRSSKIISNSLKH